VAPQRGDTGAPRNAPGQDKRISGIGFGDPGAGTGPRETNRTGPIRRKRLMS